MLKRILVLDDNQDILDMVNEVLTYENYSVHATTNGNGIVEIAKNFRPDLAILDYKLTYSDGVEICRELRAQPEFKDMPMILFSAYINREHVDYEKYGYNDMITKPFNLSDLLDKVDKLVNKA